MLRLAVELGWLHAVPAIHKPRVDPDDDTDQPWLRTPKELGRFLNAASAEIAEQLLAAQPCSARCARR